MHLKIVKIKTCRKWANGLKIWDSEKIWTPGVDLPPPRGNIHVYYNNIQRSSSLISSRPIKAKFYRKYLWEVGTNFITIQVT